MSISFGKRGDGLHLLGRGIARNAADGLQRNGHDPIARHLMRRDILPNETGEIRVFGHAFGDRARLRRPRRQIGQGEIGTDPVDFRLRQGQHRRLAAKFRFDRRAHFLGAFLVHQDLDAGLEFVVAAAFEIVDAQNRIRIGEEIGLSAGNRGSYAPTIGVRPRPPPT